MSPRRGVDRGILRNRKKPGARAFGKRKRKHPIDPGPCPTTELGESKGMQGKCSTHVSADAATNRRNFLKRLACPSLSRSASSSVWRAVKIRVDSVRWIPAVSQPRHKQFAATCAKCLNEAANKTSWCGQIKASKRWYM